MALNFPLNPADGDTYENYVYDATEGVWNANPQQLASRFITSATQPSTPSNGDGWFDTNTGKTYIYYNDGSSAQWIESGYPVLGYQTLEGLTDTSFSTATAGEKLVYNGTNWVNLEGYVYVDTVYFTSSGTFTKASYPWLRAVRVKVQGAGAGGSGAEATLSNEISGGGGGGGGGYAEKFITDIAGLDASVTVTVGSGGAGGNGVSNSSGGGASLFGAIQGNGGGGSGFTIAGTVAPRISLSGYGGSSSGGDLNITGGGGSGAVLSAVAANGAIGGAGGGSRLASPTLTQRYTGAPGNGIFPGGGGGGAANVFAAAQKTGGTGANGIVIVELYA